MVLSPKAHVTMASGFNDDVFYQVLDFVWGQLRIVGRFPSREAAQAYLDKHTPKSIR